MISSSDSCCNLVAGNYDVLVNDELPSQKTILKNFLKQFQQYELEYQQTFSNQQQTATTTTITIGNHNNIYDTNNIYNTDGFNNRSSDKCHYADEFRSLKEFSRSLKADKSNFEAGEREYNLSKNRYKDIIPFTQTRVLLSTNYLNNELPGADYINANYIRGSSGEPKAYIACQGPLPSTLNDFWRMIWECQVSVIIMACNENEVGETKCELYWPQEINSSHCYGNIQVTLLKVRQICSDFMIRKFSIKWLQPETKVQQQQDPQASINNTGLAEQHQQKHLTNQQCTYANNRCDDTDSNYNANYLRQAQIQAQSDQSTKPLDSDLQHQPPANSEKRLVVKERTICQFHYTTWPDHGVPNSVEPILEMIRLVRDVQPDDDRPILVHCSAGCGRTGTICCIDYVWNLLNRGNLNSSFNLCNIISDMRRQRMSMVQTLEQYILCYKAVAALFLKHLDLINNFHPEVGSPTSNLLLKSTYKNALEFINTKGDEYVQENGRSEAIDRNFEDDYMDKEDDLGPVFI